MKNDFVLSNLEDTTNATDTTTTASSAPSSILPPTQESLKELDILDIAIMSSDSDNLRKNLKKYIMIDPFTTSDPFDDNDNYIYSIIVDKTDTRKIISMIAIQKDAISLLKIPWIGILGNKFTKIEISKETAIKLKYELMPKDTNNFYPIRIEDGKVIGMIMFALQICGQH